MLFSFDLVKFEKSDFQKQSHVGKFLLKRTDT